jgi:DNA polymerase
MSNSNNVLILDFETASQVDLRKTGVDVYAKHKSTHIICMSYAFNDEPVQTWVPRTKGHEAFPRRVLAHIRARGEVIAHNATFERAIWNTIIARGYFGMPMMHPTQLTQDTMIRAAYWGLPMGLDSITEALGLPFGKDPEGHKAMLRCTKPRGLDEYNHPIWWHDTDKAKLAAVVKYCAQDVELERVIHKLLPALPDDTVEEYIFDMNMNQRGLRIDHRRVANMMATADLLTAKLDTTMFKITGGQVKDTRALKDLKNYLGVLGVRVSDLAKADVSELLARQLPNQARLALELRQEAAKTSVSKLKAMLASMDQDSIIRNVFQFYGAHRTGRYAGRLIQPQNFPRPHLKRDALEEYWGRVMQSAEEGSLQLISSLLRSTILPHAGDDLVVVDFAQIEARVLAWIAGQHDILQVFASGADVYTYAAKKIGSDNRQLGKVMTLGLGYGMGPDRFLETASAAPYNVKMTLAEAQVNVKAWRDANSKIKKLWWDFDSAIVDAITTHRGQWITPSRECDIKVGCFFHDATGVWCLLIKLPSGRLLVYREPEYDPTDGVSYMGVDQYTKQWTRVRSYGAKFIENIVQAIARDLMLWVMLKVEKILGHMCVGTVHDEGIWSVPKNVSGTALKAIEQLIEQAPNMEPWMVGLPLKGEGFVAERYGK